MKKLLLNSKTQALLFLTLCLLFAGGAIGQTVITTGNTVAASSITAGNTVTINAGGTLDMDVARTFASITANNSGTSTISGSNLLTVTGAVTIETGNTLSLNPNCNAASLTNSYTSTTPAIISGSGTLTLTGALTVVSGSVASPSADGTIEIGANATVICTSIVRGTGTRNHNITVSGTLKNSGTTGVINVFTCNTGSTVEYNGAAQTVHVNVYYNLILSGSGAKTITSIATINGDFTLSGTVTASSASAKAIGGNFTIGSGTSFTVTAGALTVGGNLSIGSGATFNAGTSLTHNVGGDWTNDGSFSFTTASTINFNGNNALQQIKGSAVTGFGIITVNKGTSASNILEATVPFTMTAATTTNTLKLTNGTFKVSSASTLTPFGGTNIIFPATAGFYLNNASAVSNWGSTGNPTVKGELTIAAGTMNIGTGADVLTIGTGTVYNQSGGTLNLNGRMLATQTGASFTMSGGDFNIPAGGTVNTAANSIFQIGSVVTLSITGGTVTVASANANTTKPDISITSSGTPITGGTFVASDATITVNSNVPFYNFSVQNGAGTGTAKLMTAAIQVTNDISIASGSTLNANNLNISVGGNWTNNSGTFTPGTGTVSFTNTSADQNINGTSSTQTFYKLTLAKTATKLNIGGSTTKVTVSNTLTMTSGNIDCGSNTLELGTSTAAVGTLTYTSGNIIGNFKRWISSTGTGIVFPVGTSSDNRKALVTFTNLTAGSLTAIFIASDPGSTGLPLGESSYTINNQFTEGYWSLTAADALASTNYALELTGTNFTSYTEDANVRIIKRSTGGSWALNGTHVAGVAPTAKRSGISGFGEFAHGKGIACLTGAGTPSPSTQTICENATGTIAVAATGGTAPFSYQWYSNTINSNSGGSSLGSANGAQTATYTAQPGSPGNTYYYATIIQTGSACATATSATATVTRNALPTAIISYAGPFCETDATVYSVSLSGTGAYTGGTYSASPAGLNINTTTGDITPLGSTVGTYTVTYTIPASGVCGSVPVTTSVTITALPVATFSYTGSTYCNTASNPFPTFSGGGVAGVFSSTTGLVFANTATGEINLAASTIGTYTVTNTIAASGGCAQVTATNSITIDSFRVDSIIGPTNACPYMSVIGDTATYSVSTHMASGFTWTVPTYATIISGQGTNTITVFYDTLFVSGTISVSVTSTCGSPIVRNLSITKSVPAKPGLISGPMDACPYVTSGGPATYTIAAVPDALYYEWTLPAFVTYVSGQGTTSLTVTFDSGYVAAPLFVKSVSGCGFSADTSITIPIVLPVAPGTISGPTNACFYIDTTWQATYTINKVPLTTSYIWTMPTGATIATHPNGLGVNDTTITVTFDNSFVTSTFISVQAASICGVSPKKNLTILRSVARLPNTISGPTNACPLMISATNPTGTQATYTISSVSTATSYDWTVPAGATLDSHPNGLGMNDTTILVTYGSSFTSGSVTVDSKNGCGASAARTLAIIRSLPATPGAMSGPTNACPLMISATNPTGTQATYSISPVANATGYTWNVPTGATIDSHPNGSGVNDTIILVTYGSTFTSGNVTVMATNNCANSTVRSLAISRTIPATPGNITGPTDPCPWIGTSGATYTIRKVTNAAGYTWSVPSTGATITSHPGGSGVNDTIIIVDYSSAFTTGSVSVTADVNCGSSAAKTLALTRKLPGIPSAITTSVLSGCTNRRYIYSVAALPTNATSVTWTVPSGETIDSLSNGTLYCYVSYVSGAISGSVTAAGVNNCATGTARTLAISLTSCGPFAPTLPANPVAKSNIGQLQPADNMDVRILPNPSVQDFKLQVSASAKEIIHVQITDIAGRLMKEFTVMPSEVHSFGNDLKAGTYFIKVQQGNKVKTTKLLKF